MNPNTETIPFHKPSFDADEKEAVLRVLESGWLTTGPESRAFEEEFAAVLSGTGTPEPEDRPPIQALSLNSATAGLHLAVEALGIGPGDIVAVPSLTFTATAEVVSYPGADLLFIDSDPRTGNMCPNALREAYLDLDSRRDRLKAVIVVHLAGNPCPMEELRRAVSGSGAAFIEDAAHAFPSPTPAGMAGDLADIGVFSFYATKTITTGEGGMVCTRRPEIAKRMRLMRLHGIDRDVWNRYSSKADSRSWVYDVSAPGYKYNMTDLAAAIGRVQLKKAYQFRDERVHMAEVYRNSLKDLKSLTLPQDAPGHAWHLFIIKLSGTRLRDHLAAELKKHNIGSSVHFIPLHEMTYWKNRYKLQEENLPVAHNISSRCLSLPLWPGMDESAQKRIISVIRDVLDG